MAATYDFQLKGFDLTPGLSLDYLRTHHPAFAESWSNGRSLSFDSLRHESLEAGFNLNVSRQTALENGIILVPYLDLGIAVETGDRVTELWTSAKLDLPTIPVGPYVTGSQDLGRVRFNAGLGLEAQPRENVSFKLGWTGDFQKGYCYNQAQASVSFHW